MTEDTLRALLQDVFLKANEKQTEWNIFIFAYNVNTQQGFHTGFGCPGCSVEAINDAADRGELPHTGKTGHTHEVH